MNNLGIQSITLPNGFQVIVKENHNAPIFAHAVYYRTGSRHDQEMFTGAAHFLEHMQFNGTSKYPKGAIPTEIESRGGTFNAGTSYDYTVYYMNLPSESHDGVSNLRFAMDLEADRMRGSIINDKEAERERQVVLSELAMGENNSLTSLFKTMLREMSPGHPYGDPIIGWIDDVKRTTAKELKAQYDRYYQPNNAFLVVVGDVNKDEVYQLAEEIYGQIPPSGTGIPTVAERTTRQSFYADKKEIEVYAPTETSAVMLGWDTVAFSDDDYMPLQLLSSVLTEGLGSRLQKKLIETGLLSDVDSNQRQAIDQSCFYVLGVASKSKDISSLQTAKDIIISEIQSIAQRGITSQELQKAKAKTKTDLLLSIEEPMDMAMHIGQYEIMGHGYQGLASSISNLEKISTGDIKRVAQKYLSADKAFIARLLDETQKNNGKKELKIVSKNNQQTIKPEIIDLDNGLRIIYRHDPDSALIALHGTIDAGEIYDISEGKHGLSALSAQLLTRGTKEYTKKQIHEQIDLMGAYLEYGRDFEAISLNGYFHAEDLDHYMQLAAETMIQPSYPEPELDILKQQYMQVLEQSKGDIGYRTKSLMTQTLFPEDHPLREPSIDEQAKDIQGITSQELISYHQKYYRPERTIITISGSIGLAEIKSTINKYFGQWASSNSTEARAFSLPAVTGFHPQGLVSDTMPGKSQANVILAHPTAIKRSDADYYALLVANDILGAGSSLASRLGTGVREEAGLVYTIYSMPITGRAGQYYAIKMGTDSQNIDQAIHITQREVKRFLEDGITDEELERAKQYRKGAFVAGNLTSNGNIAAALNMYMLWGMDLDTINDYTKIIDGLTKQEVIEAARRYIQPDQLQVIVVKPEKENNQK